MSMLSIPCEYQSLQISSLLYSVSSFDMVLPDIFTKQSHNVLDSIPTNLYEFHSDSIPWSFYAPIYNITYSPDIHIGKLIPKFRTTNFPPISDSTYPTFSNTLPPGNWIYTFSVRPCPKPIVSQSIYFLYSGTISDLDSLSFSLSEHLSKTSIIYPGQIITISGIQDIFLVICTDNMKPSIFDRVTTLVVWGTKISNISNQISESSQFFSSESDIYNFKKIVHPTFGLSQTAFLGTCYMNGSTEIGHPSFEPGFSSKLSHHLTNSQSHSQIFVNIGAKFHVQILPSDFCVNFYPVENKCVMIPDSIPTPITLSPSIPLSNIVLSIQDSIIYSSSVSYSDSIFRFFQSMGSFIPITQDSTFTIPLSPSDYQSTKTVLSYHLGYADNSLCRDNLSDPLSSLVDSWEKIFKSLSPSLENETSTDSNIKNQFTELSDHLPFDLPGISLFSPSELVLRVHKLDILPGLGAIPKKKIQDIHINTSTDTSDHVYYFSPKITAVSILEKPFTGTLDPTNLTRQTSLINVKNIPMSTDDIHYFNLSRNNNIPWAPWLILKKLFHNDPLLSMLRSFLSKPDKFLSTILYAPVGYYFESVLHDTALSLKYSSFTINLDQYYFPAGIDTATLSQRFSLSRNSTFDLNQPQNSQNSQNSQRNQIPQHFVNFLKVNLKQLVSRIVSESKENNVFIILQCSTRIPQLDLDFLTEHTMPDNIGNRLLNRVDVGTTSSLLGISFTPRVRVCQWIQRSIKSQSFDNLGSISWLPGLTIWKRFLSLYYSVSISHATFSNSYLLNQILNNFTFDSFVTRMKYHLCNSFEKLNENVQIISKINSPSDLCSPVSFSDVGGQSENLSFIKKRILTRISHSDLFAASSTSGILLWGPPGNGKTLIAKALAHESGVPFHSVNGSELLSQYVGESESNVRAVFAKARNQSPCVLFFDEIDALAPSRTSKSTSSHGVMNRIVSQLMTEMENNPDIFILAATNRPDLLDQSLLRPGRFDQTLYIGPPKDVSAKASILKASLDFRIFSFLNDPTKRDSLLSQVASMIPQGVSGADIASVGKKLIRLVLEKKIRKGSNRRDSPGSLGGWGWGFGKLPSSKTIENNVGNISCWNPLFSFDPKAFPAKYINNISDNLNLFDSDNIPTASLADLEREVSNLVPSLSKGELARYEKLAQEWG